MKKNAFGPRRAFLFFVVVCLLAAAAGCGADGQPDGEDELPELVIASDSYEPYHYIEANGDHAGIDVELAREACSRLGYRPVFLDIAWEDKDSYLEKGLADCLWGCFTMTGREQDYQWAGPYLVSRQTVLVRADSGIGRLADLAGLRVAVQASGKAEQTLLQGGEGVPEVGAVYSFSGMSEVYSCLRKGYADAIAGHESSLDVLRRSDEERYVMLDEELYTSQLGVAFRKDTHEELARQLTEAFEEMRADGTIRAIAEKYGLNVEKALDW